MLTSSSSDSDDDSAVVGPLYTSMTAIGKPYSRYQGSYLSNLQKLLNEGEVTGASRVLRWHPKISNALEINWAMFETLFHEVHPVLVQYKLSRASNRLECVRPTMNRKLREWNFKMVCTCTAWVCYIYDNEAFGRAVHYGQLPTRRRGART